MQAEVMVFIPVFRMCLAVSEKGVRPQGAEQNMERIDGHILNNRSLFLFSRPFPLTCYHTAFDYRFGDISHRDSGTGYSI